MNGCMVKVVCPSSPSNQKKSLQKQILMIDKINEPKTKTEQMNYWNKLCGYQMLLIKKSLHFFERFEVFKQRKHLK